LLAILPAILAGWHAHHLELAQAYSPALRVEHSAA
jgi:hypothetical protein